MTTKNTVTTQDTSGRPIVEIVKPRTESGLLGRMRRRWHSLTGKAGTEALFVVQPAPEGPPKLSKLHPDAEAPPRRSTVARVNTGEQPLRTLFANVVTDDAQHRWDLVLQGKWQVEDPRVFLRRRALEVASIGAPLTREATGSWIARTLKRDVNDWLKSHKIEDLRDRDELPPAWWTDKVRDQLGEYGLGGKIETLEWESADAAREEEERRREEELDRIERERDKRREAELREDEARIRYESQKTRIHHDQRIQDAERNHQMKILEAKHRMEMLQAANATAKTRWSHEKAALEHDLMVARLRQDPGALHDAERRWAEMEQRQRLESQHFTEADDAFGRLTVDDEAWFVGLAADDAATAHQTAERLTSPEFAISPGALNALGFAVERQDFIARLSAQRDMSGHQVTLNMAALRGRDIGTSRNDVARVDSLPIGGSLRFELTSTLAGYVTIVNIGTSGKSWLQVPNPFVSPEAARIEANQTITVPGPLLLPDSAVEGYFELGPPGWEHMAVTVTDLPIVAPEFLQLASPEAPFIDLTTDAAAELAAALEEANPDQYAIGLASFLVE